MQEEKNTPSQQESDLPQGQRQQVQNNELMGPEDEGLLLRKRNPADMEADSDADETTVLNTKTEHESYTDETLFETLTSCRWVLAYTGCLLMLVLYALRTNMGIAIVCMVKPSNLTMQEMNKTMIADACPLDNTTTGSQDDSKQDIHGDIVWSKMTQGWVLSSFFYGYIVTQIPGGWLAGRFGGKRVMLGGMSIYAVVTLLTPVAARFDGVNYDASAGLVIALRVIAGLATGVVFPAWHNLCGKWAPPYERSRIYVLVSSGMYAGNVLMLGAGGFFCQWESFDGGWPSIFYVGGILCILFCVLWHFVVFDSPLDHPRISDKERHYITSSMEATIKESNKKVPYAAIMKSPAVWGINISIIANAFGIYTLMTKLPAFMKEVLHFDIRSSGVYSALPYIVMFILANTVSQLVDYVRKKHILTTAAARKISNSLALMVPAVLLICSGHVPCDKNYLAVIFITIGIGFTSLTSSGYSANAQDIAPRYAGEVFGISNCISTIPGMIAPVAVNAMTPNGTAAEWRIVFYVWSGIFVIGAAGFVLLGRGEIQDWAVEPEELEKIKATKLKQADETDSLTSKI